MSRTPLARRYYRTIVTVIAGLLAAGTSLIVGDRMNTVDGFFYDLSLATTEKRPGTEAEPVAVVALDRDSLMADELARLPRAFLSPIWAKLLDGLIGTGATAVGFDIIFEYSANRLLGSDGQYDKGFLTALAQARDRVVLARSAQAFPALPFAAAVLDPGADIELIGDPDGVNRWMTARLETESGQSVPTLATALLARAQAPPMPSRLLLAPRAALEAIPTYRVIDVLRCLNGDPAALRRAFAGKVVLIGTNLPEEDRKRTPDRFMRPPAPRTSTAGACELDRLGASDPGSGTTPGVFVHAAAVEAVIDGDLVRPLPWLARAAAAAVFSVVGSLLGFALRPWIATLGAAALVAAGFAAALILLGFGRWFALAVPFGAAILSMVVAYVVRFLVEERRRRQVQNAFKHYLAPAVVDRLVEGEAELHLGGELREITVMFADFSGFTAMSGRLSPAALMDLTNSYLALVVAAVDATNGYVVDYVGDAVMAMWGAPLDDPDHAAHGAKAALEALASVARVKAEADARGAPGYSVRMGINSGPAVVGNVGAPGRYSYKAVGETVNIGARLEGVPDDYGCRIVVGPQTAAALADRFILCELDWVKVKGKEEAIAIYELVGEKAGAYPAMLTYPAQYGAALEQYRAGNFTSAEACWRKHAAHPSLDPAGVSPPLVMADRAAALRANPPTHWDGVYVKATK